MEFNNKSYSESYLFVFVSRASHAYENAEVVFIILNYV